MYAAIFQDEPNSVVASSRRGLCTGDRGLIRLRKFPGPQKLAYLADLNIFTAVIPNLGRPRFLRKAPRQGVAGDDLRRLPEIGWIRSLANQRLTGVFPGRFRKSRVSESLEELCEPARIR